MISFLALEYTPELNAQKKVIEKVIKVVSKKVIKKSAKKVAKKNSKKLAKRLAKKEAAKKIINSKKIKSFKDFTRKQSKENLRLSSSKIDYNKSANLSKRSIKESVSKNSAKKGTTKKVKSRIHDGEVKISDSEIPSGYGGINREGYTYGQLRKQPIINEIKNTISNPKIKSWVDECNHRNTNGFKMRRVNGEYNFEDLRVGPKVKLPSPKQIKDQYGSDLTPEQVRKISYSLLRKEISRQTGLTESQAANVIGKIDCVPHEDISGYVYMVPNWAHKWFTHKGFVSSVLGYE